MVEVKVTEDMWGAEAEGVLASWLFASGETVSAGEVIAETTVEKSVFEIEAPAAGRLVHRVAEEAIIRTGDVIAVIE